MAKIPSNKESQILVDHNQKPLSLIALFLFENMFLHIEVFLTPTTPLKVWQSPSIKIRSLASALWEETSKTTESNGGQTW